MGRRVARSFVVAIVLVASTALAWTTMVWPVLKVPYALSRARGMAREEVRRRCGAPDKEWETPAALGCYRGWCPQQRDKAKGRTWFYLTWVGVGWFAYFDANDRLYATEGNSS